MTTAAGARRASLLRSALLVVGLLLGAEALAQLVAHRVWATDWIGPTSPRDDALLFVGADETFDPGLRWRDQSWPCVVGREVDGIERVTNAAAPGRDSAELLRRLPLRLTLERPAIVVVCVGAADFARREATEVTELRGRSAPFELHPRLFPWLARQLGIGGEPAADGADPLLGDWHFGDAAFHFGPHGVLRTGDLEARWSFDDGRLRIALPGGEPFDVQWTLEGDRLDLRGAFPGGRLTLDRGVPLANATARAAVSARRGDRIEAELMLVPAIEGAKHEPDAIAALIELEVEAGQVEVARRLLARLPEAPVDDAGLRRRARAEIALGDIDRGVERLLPGLAEHARDPALIACLRDLPSGDAARRVLAAAQELLPQLTGRVRRDLAFVACDLLAADGARAAAIACGLAGLGPDAGVLDPRSVPPVLRMADEAEWLATATTAAARQALAERRRALVAADRATAAVLSANLRRAIELIRFHGAVPLLLDPADDPAASAVRRALAAELDVAIASCGAGHDELAAATSAALAALRPTGR